MQQKTQSTLASKKKVETVQIPEPPSFIEMNLQYFLQGDEIVRDLLKEIALNTIDIAEERRLECVRIPFCTRHVTQTMMIADDLDSIEHRRDKRKDQKFLKLELDPRLCVPDNYGHQLTYNLNKEKTKKKTVNGWNIARTALTAKKLQGIGQNESQMFTYKPVDTDETEGSPYQIETPQIDQDLPKDLLVYIDMERSKKDRLAERLLEQEKQSHVMIVPKGLKLKVNPKKKSNNKEEPALNSDGIMCFIENGNRFLIQNVDMHSVPDVLINQPVKPKVLEQVNVTRESEFQRNFRRSLQKKILGNYYLPPVIKSDPEPQIEEHHETLVQVALKHKKTNVTGSVLSLDSQQLEQKQIEAINSFAKVGEDGNLKIEKPALKSEKEKMKNQNMQLLESIMPTFGVSLKSEIEEPNNPNSVSKKGQLYNQNPALSARMNKDSYAQMAGRQFNNTKHQTMTTIDFAQISQQLDNISSDSQILGKDLTNFTQSNFNQKRPSHDQIFVSSKLARDSLFKATNPNMNNTSSTSFFCPKPMAITTNPVVPRITLHDTSSSYLLNKTSFGGNRSQSISLAPFTLHMKNKTSRNRIEEIDKNLMFTTNPEGIRELFSPQPVLMTAGENLNVDIERNSLFNFLQVGGEELSKRQNQINLPSIDSKFRRVGVSVTPQNFQVSKKQKSVFKP